jgi:alginate O-acetyltransferase complex protein AlgI
MKMRVAVTGGTGFARQHLEAKPRSTQHGNWVGWMPLLLLPIVVISLRAKLLPLVFMWMLAAAIFAGCKWQTWWEARAIVRSADNWRRSAAYLLLWPGMEAQEFFATGTEKQSIPASQWLAGVAKTLGGIALIWAGARMVSLARPLLGGWAGMVGLVLFLHFGTFHLIALAWQRSGIPVKPIMRRPLASRSLNELWGKRWNLGYRKLSHTLVFLPLQKRFGPVFGTLGAFLTSGLLHDLVISVPAGAGYGLPTAYFLTQGLGVIVERSKAGREFGLGRGIKGWLWTALIAIGPLYALFHPWFVMRVIVPFLSAIAG